MKQILIVDDDKANCDFLTSVLVQEKYEVEVAFNGIEALEKVESAKYDIVISDIFMPEMNGIDLLKKIKALSIPVMVIMITGQGDPVLKKQSMHHGAVSYLEKPFKVSELISAVAKVLHQSAGFRGNVSEINLFDLIQFLTVAKKTKILEVQYKQYEGKIYIYSGEIIHAVTPNKQGEAAFLECLSWKSGSFSDVEWSPPKQRTIQKSVDQLLMEAAQLVDEVLDEPEPEVMHEPVQPAATLSQSGPRLDIIGDRLLAIEGVVSLTWLNNQGELLAGSGHDASVISGVAQFLIGMEEQLRSFVNVTRVRSVYLYADDGRAIVLVHFKAASLAALVAEGHRPEDISDAMMRTIMEEIKG